MSKSSRKKARRQRQAEQIAYLHQLKQPLWRSAVSSADVFGRRAALPSEIARQLQNGTAAHRTVNAGWPHSGIRMRCAANRFFLSALEGKAALAILAGGSVVVSHGRQILSSDELAGQALGLVNQLGQALRTVSMPLRLDSAGPPAGSLSRNVSSSGKRASLLRSFRFPLVFSAMQDRPGPCVVVRPRDSRGRIS